MKSVFSTLICLPGFVYLDLRSWIFLLGFVLKVSAYIKMCKSIVAVTGGRSLEW